MRKKGEREGVKGFNMDRHGDRLAGVLFIGDVQANKH